MNNNEFMQAIQMMNQQNGQRQQMNLGGDIGAGFAGVGKGIFGSVLPGPLGNMATQGIDSIHGLLDKDITDKEKAISGFGQAAGAIGTAAFTGGATLAAGADDIAQGLGTGIAKGTRYGTKNHGENQAGIMGVANMAGMLGGMGAGNLGGGAGAQTTPGFGGTPPINGGMAEMAQSFAPQGGNPFATQGGLTGLEGFGQQMNMQGLGASFKYGGRKQMAAGGLTEFQGGGTHEENPNGGIPFGGDASVEDGETAMDMPSDNGDMSKFVFSKQLKEGKKSFADQSKTIEKKFKDRPNDSAAKRAKDQMLKGLAERQEALKATKMAELQAKMTELGGAPQGGQPVIAPDGREQLAYGGLTDTASILDFQKYASGEGADLGAFGPNKKGLDGKTGKFTDAAWDKYGKLYQSQLGFNSPSTNNQAGVGAGALNPLNNIGGAGATNPLAASNQASYDAEYANIMGNQNTLAGNNLESYTKEYNSLMSDEDRRLADDAQAQHVRNRNLSIGTGAALNSAGDIYGLIQGLRGGEDINLDRLDPDMINLRKQREIAQRNAAGSQANLREGMRRSGNLSGMVAGNAAIDQNLGNLLTQSMLNEETQNVGIRNAADQGNQAISTQEQMLNLQAQAKSQEAIQAGLNGIGGNASQGLLDSRNMDQTDIRNKQQLNSMNALLNNFTIGKDGNITFKQG
tara:strand:- start:1069 stop:3126 length:2058 start_codon:yes stop_codon:yes gene_type:complete